MSLSTVAAEQSNALAAAQAAAASAASSAGSSSSAASSASASANATNPLVALSSNFNDFSADADDPVEEPGSHQPDGHQRVHH